MTDDALLSRITRSLAFLLRHQPEQYDLELDAYGYAPVDETLRALNEKLGEPVSMEDVLAALQAGDRVRYEIQGDRIRALYGHSIRVEPGPAAKPPETLYIAIPTHELERARRFGLRGGRRRFLHLAQGLDDAREAGRRLAEEYTVLRIRALDAWEEGVNFYDRISLWLAEELPTHLLEIEGSFDDGTAPAAEVGRFQRNGRGERRGRGERGSWRDRDRGRGRGEDRRETFGGGWEERGAEGAPPVSEQDELGGEEGLRPERGDDLAAEDAGSPGEVRPAPPAEGGGFDGERRRERGPRRRGRRGGRGRDFERGGRDPAPSQGPGDARGAQRDERPPPRYGERPERSDRRERGYEPRREERPREERPPEERPREERPREERRFPPAPSDPARAAPSGPARRQPESAEPFGAGVVEGAAPGRATRPAAPPEPVPETRRDPPPRPEASAPPEDPFSGFGAGL